MYCSSGLEADQKAGKNPRQQIPLDDFKLMCKKLVKGETLYEQAPEEVELKSAIENYTRMKATEEPINIDQSLSYYLSSTHSYSPPYTYGQVLVSMGRSKPSAKTSDSYIEALLSLINQIHPTKPPSPFPPESFNMVPIRIAILGDAFVGKKTAATRLAKILKVPIIDIVALINKAKSYLKYLAPQEDEDEENPDEEDENKAADNKKGNAKEKKKPQNPPPKAAAQKKSEPPPVLTERELEYQRFGVKIRNLEVAKYPIPDDLKYELLMFELKPVPLEHRFEQAKNAFISEKNASEERKLAKANKANEPKPVEDKKKMGDKTKSAAKLKEQENASQHALKPEDTPSEPQFDEVYPYTRGYILLNFPSTIEELLLWNKKQTNYVPLDERLSPEAESMKAMARKLYPVPPTPSEHHSFPPLDYVFVLDLQRDQILSRAESLRLDPTTGIMYDPIINPASETDKKLVARLEPVKYDPEALDKAIASFDSNRVAIKDYLKKFGYEQLHEPIFQMIDASKSPEEITTYMVNKIKQLLDLKYSWYRQGTDALPESIKELLKDEIHGGSDQLNGDNSESNSVRGGIPVGSEKNVVGSPQLSQGRYATKSMRSGSHRGSYYKEGLSAKSGSRRDRLLFKCLENFDSIFQDYFSSVEKNILNAKENFELIRFQLGAGQKDFANIFKEKSNFHLPLTNFLESYKKLQRDHPESVKTTYCQNRLHEKIDKLHDQMWVEIARCREVALVERGKMASRGLVMKNVHDMCKMALSLVASEINKLCNSK
jgi:hypothetical protein